MRDPARKHLQLAVSHKSSCEASRRAECGKSARSVRRGGEWKPAYGSISEASLTMPARVKFFFRFFLSSLFFFRAHNPLHSGEWSYVVLLNSAPTSTARFVIVRSASVRPRHLIDQNFDHDYFFKLPLKGAGCPITLAVFYCTPCLTTSCPACEPNSNDGEYSHPFRHIQYNRIPIRRPIATLAMLLCRRIAR